MENQFQIFETPAGLLDLLTVVLVVGTALGASFVLFWLVRRYLASYAKRTESKVDDIILSILKGPVYLLIVVYGGIWLLRILAERYPGQIPNSVFPTVDLLYVLVLVFVGTWAGYALFGKLMAFYARRLARQTGSRVDDLLLGFFGRVGKIVIAIIGVSVALGVLRIDVTGFLAGLGIAGLAIALAMQDTLTNMVSGISIMLDKKYRVGDRILLDSGELCDVREVSLRATRLYNISDHTIISLPNNQMAKMKIVNWSEPDRRIKLNLAVDVAYHTDVDRVKTILLELASGQTNVLKDPAPSAFFTSFQESSLRLTLTVWVDDFHHLGDVQDQLNTSIKDRFEKDKIEIPYPTRTVLMKSMS